MRLRKLPKIFFSILILFIAIVNYSSAEENKKSVEAMAAALVDGLADNLTASPLNVTIGRMTLENSNFSGEFADKFLSLMESELGRHKADFNLITRMAYSRGLKKNKSDTSENVVLTRGGLVLVKSALNDEVKDATLEGSYRKIADKGIILVTARLVGADNITKYSEYSVQIPASMVKWALKPANIKKAKKIEKEVGKPESGSAFKLDMWIDRSDGGTYREGDELSIWVRTAEDCYLKILYIDAAGNRVLMFPTESNDSSKIKAGRTYRLDDYNTYTVVPPFGSEMIIAFASSEPFQNVEEISLGSNGLRRFSSDRKTADIVNSLRGIQISGKSSKRAETKVHLTTVRK